MAVGLGFGAIKLVDCLEGRVGVVLAFNTRRPALPEHPDRRAGAQPTMEHP